MGIALATAFLAVSVGCDSGPTAAEPAVPGEVVKLGGDLQAGPVTEPLPDRLVVEVRDTAGAPIPGVALSWTPCGRGGTVVDADPVTDDLGRARATWVLGTTTGVRSVTVRTGGQQAVFNGTALPGPPATLEAVTGDGQQGPSGEPLPVRIRARVLDVHGNAVGGAEVDWRVTAGGGHITAVTGVSHPNGVVGAEWVLGGPGTQRLEVRADQAVFTFTATATVGDEGGSG